ncbi:MAG: hypothetical protein JW936_10555 [Sedimentisphaerales bacterium]|nr:hypothetical protein [Sedimentisphaerales bacterium]
MIERILSQLEHKSTGEGKWQAKCPAHDDKRHSLTITKQADRILLHCHAGCAMQDIIAALGLKPADLFPNSQKRESKPKQQGDIIYDYTDENGKLLMQAVRRPDKSFCQRKPDGSGGWTYKLGNLRRVLYHLPELIASTGPVFIVEGEKDVDNLRALGLTATCNVGGAGKWKEDYGHYLKGRKVVILPDNDDPGRKHALQVAEMLSEVTETIKILNLPDLQVKGDVSDWIEAGGTREQLLELAGAAVRYQLPAKRSAGGKTSKTYLRTDVGNGERFADLYGRRLRYCYTLGCWMVWDGRKWDLQRGEAHSRLLVAEMVQRMGSDAAQSGNQAERDWAFECQKSARISAILLEAKGRLATYGDELDSDPWLFNCQNGVLDLRSGELKAHDPDLLITKIAPVDYDPQADCTAWNNFLDVILAKDYEVMAFLQAAIGYSLTGSTREEKLFFVHGPGAAGKSTFVEAVKSTLGDYAITSDFETFLAKSGNEGARNDIARLKSSRFVASIEVDDGKRLAEGLVKTITGSDTITARYLYKEAFEFRPQFKLWLCANHEPRVKQGDDAIWRRILRIPFDHAIPEDKRDPQVKATLTDPAISGAAILRWAVEGCLSWQKVGLSVPNSIKDATNDYRAKMDPLADWLAENATLVTNWMTPVTILRKDYDDWAEENGVKFTVGRNVFNERMRTLGITLTTQRYGWARKPQKCWVGIKLNDDESLQQ